MVNARARALQLLAGSPATGHALLQLAAEALALGLDCPWAGFGRAEPDGKSIEILAFWSRGRLSAPFRYAAAGSPCGAIYATSPDSPYRYFERQVAERFAKPDFLAELAVQSYRGEAIFDSNAELLGHVFAMSDRARAEDEDDKAFFRLVARRAGAEYRRLLSQNALQQSEARNRDIVERLPDMVCRFRPDGVLTFVNEAYCRFFGRDREQLLGRSFFDLIPEEDHAGARAQLRSITRDRPQDSYEHQAIARGGEVRWQRWTDQGFFDEQGNVVEFLSIGRDITEARRAQEALRESGALISSIADIVPAAISHIGPDLRYRFANKTYETWFNIPREAIIGSSVGTLIGEAAFQRAEPYIERVLAGEEVDFENLVPYGVGGERHIYVQFRPRFNDQGEQDGFVSLVQDVSEQKRNERALQQAKESAEQTNASKSRFLAAASHDLRQPLHALKFLLAALPNAPADRRDGIVERMFTAVESMGAMLDSLLDVSELEAGAVRPELSFFRVNGLFGQIFDNVATRGQAKGLDCRVVPSTAVVHSDPALLARIVENFLTNAVRYTESGKVLLGCRRRGGKLRIEVWDSGVGIAKEELGAIFEEFHQIANPGRDRSLGLGLGLAIAQRLTQILGHRIDVQSRVGRGSMFAVEVPLAESGPASDRADHAAEPGAGGLDGKLILVIENEPEVLQSTEELLTSWGAAAIGAASSAEAIEKATSGETPPDLVVADYRLSSRASGLDAIQGIRDRLERPVPAVVVTGDIEPETLKQLEASGVPVLVKPVDSERLRVTVLRLLEGHANAA